MMEPSARKLRCEGAVRRILDVAIILTLAGLFGPGAHAQVPLPREPKRIAIVITNGAYQVEDAVLPNSEADRGAAVEFFTKLNFDQVIPFSFATLAEYDAKITAAAASVVSDDMVVIYYSGHGFAYRGANYMVGTAFDGTTANVSDFSVPVYLLPRRFWRNGAGLVFIIFDGCRSIPFRQAEGLSDIAPSGPRLVDDDRNRRYSILFANERGMPAFAGSRADAVSPFTRIVTETLRADRTILSRVFVEEVQATASVSRPQFNPDHKPGTLKSTFHFVKDQEIRDAERREWENLRNEGDRILIEKYYRVKRVTAWAAQIRHWLVETQDLDTENNTAGSYSARAPESANMAFQNSIEGGQTNLAFRRLGVPFAFEASRLSGTSPNSAVASAIETLGQLSVMPSGRNIKRAADYDRILEGQRDFDINALNAYRESAVALNSDDNLSIRAAPRPDAATVLGSIPFGARIKLGPVVKVGEDDWSQVIYETPERTLRGYLQIPESKPAAPFESGPAFGEITVTADRRFPTFIEEAPLIDFINRMKEANKVPGTVYVESQYALPEDEDSDSAEYVQALWNMRVLDIKQIFRRNGVDIDGRLVFSPKLETSGGVAAPTNETLERSPFSVRVLAYESP